MHDLQLDVASLLKQSAACIPERVRTMATPHPGYNDAAFRMDQYKVSCLPVVARVKATYAMQ